MADATKVKVIEVDATKLDPNAHYIIALQHSAISVDRVNKMLDELKENNIKATIVMLATEKVGDAIKVFGVVNKDNK